MLDNYKDMADRAALIRYACEERENTPERVGGLFSDIVAALGVVDRGRVVEFGKLDSVNILTIGWSQRCRIVNPFLPAFTRQMYRHVRLFRLSIPVSRYFRDFFSTFLFRGIINENNRTDGLSASLSL